MLYEASASDGRPNTAKLGTGTHSAVVALYQNSIGMMVSKGPLVRQEVCSSGPTTSMIGFCSAAAKMQPSKLQGTTELL